MRVLGAGHSSRIRTDLVMMLHEAGRQVGGQSVARAAASASKVRTLTVARLPRSAAYPYESESVR